MLRFFSRYMVAVGALVNLLGIVFLLYWAHYKVMGSQIYSDVRRSVFGSLDGVDPVELAPVKSGTINPAFRTLPVGSWVKIHQQEIGSKNVFKRQVHGGAAFDPVRSRVMLFGSDTHSRDWNNSVWMFDMGALNWSQPYPEDNPDTYRVNQAGIPVAGIGVERPWAMHTFDAVEFDAITDRLIVASHPSHLSPDKAWGVDRNLWQSIKKHPTWIYHVGENRWEPLPGDSVSLFPYAATFDPKRRVLIGVKSDGYWELSADSGAWTRLAKGAPYAYHNAAAYDGDQDIVVSFGTQDRSNDVWQFDRDEAMGRKMSTPGLRPPGADSAPLAYHPGVKRVIALVERPTATPHGLTETWLYSTAEDAWSRLDGADLPFSTGMNYNLVYDPGHDLLVLVANIPGEPTAVWVLRLEG